MNTRLIPNRDFPVNLVTHLQKLAQERPHDTALVTVAAADEQLIEQRFDYRTLDQRVKAFAAVLQDCVPPGERALLLMENDAHYVIGFLACLYAGVIAVPVFPPESVREQHMARLLAIAADAQARCIVTTGDSLPLLGDAGLTRLSGMAVLTVDTADSSRAQDWRVFEPQGEDIAFLQYTSGSTATPKGVMVSHHNLMTNARVFEEGMSIAADDIFVSWLPLYHDMGLIGGLLQPIHRAVPVILMTPKFFVERPIRWLEVISRYRATVSGAPNFAFQLCADRVRTSQLQALDLSCWRVAFCGAEPVRQDTMRAFVERFASAGFPAGTIYPCYGLAEATLFVTGGVRGEGMKVHAFTPGSLAQGKAEPADTGIPVVACGFPASGHAVRIVDPGTLIALPDGCVGEIWTTGDSLAQGYWQRPEESAEAFVHQDGSRWLRTGDLGFVHARQLHIMGRRKDLIIIRGQNIYPQDIELVIEEEVEAVRKGRVAVFSVELEDGEGIGVAAEISRSMQKLVGADTLVQVLGEAVSAGCHEPLSVAVLLNPGALPKTSSGKLQRTACRQGWLDRTLDAYAIYEHGHFVLGGGNRPDQFLLDDIESEVAAIWAAVLNRTEFGRDDHFFAAGGNSLKAVQAVARICDRWNIPFTPRSLFQYPRLHECAAEIRQLVAKRETLPACADDNRKIPQCDRTGVLPLSHGQQRLWFLWQLDPAGTAYHVQHAVQLAGALDLQVLRESFADLTGRHESLRTIFRANDDGTAEQVILPSVLLPFEVIDLSTVLKSEHDRRIPEESAHLLAQPFDLTQGPLLRVAVIRLEAHQHVLVIVMHHIIADGASMQILFDELAACYQARVQGKSADLAPLPVQYADYARWHLHWLEEGEKANQLAYWKNYLGIEHTVLQLPVDRARQPVTGYRAARCRFDLPDDVVQSLRQLPAARGVTVFMGLLAAFQALLFRHTGQSDIRVGVPVANRNRIETAALIGFFVNTQVMRARLHGRMTLDELLRQIREDAVNAQTYQDLPFEQLVEALHPQRDLRHSPLFQVTLNHLQLDYRLLQQRTGLAVSDYSLPEPAGQLEFRLETVESPDGRICGHFIYAADLFSGDAMERMARQYLRILRVLIAHPDTAVGDIDLLDDAEKQSLTLWGMPPADAADDPPVHRRIEEQAKNRPDAIAVVASQRQLSYAELNNKANRLAHRLIALGVKPEMRVGISVARDSAALLIGLLAILKAGGGYVPLDPEYPQHRLDYMIKDSGIRLLLTQTHFLEKLPAVDGLAVIELDHVIDEAGSEINPDVALHRDNLAYVIYTSGSTGRPKGVSVAHGPLAMHLSAIKRVYDVRADDRELMFFSMNFDAAAEQWITPLTEGAALVLCSPEHLAGEGFAGLIAAQRITVLHLPPAYLRMLLPLLESDCRQVRSCIVGGEAWHAADVAAARGKFRQARLINAYGPTETVITPTAWTSDAGQDLARQLNGEFTPIGRPVGKRYAYVLDAEMNLATPGAVGELYIGGDGLARGYLDRAGLTAGRFVADPFDQAGGRLYRTGDLVRWRGDGQLEYLGRADQQVKLRGFRVELGEIEAQLLALESVREAAVVAQHGPNGLRLVAYVGVFAAVQRDAAALKSALAAVLPDYMIPGLFVFLDALPLTPNGKIDRQALPAPDLSADSDYDPPVGDMETKIAGIWAAVLQVAQVGLHNNFFDLGGHSLLLIKVKQRLEAELQVPVAIVDLFKYTTVASLAKFLSQGEAHPAALPRHQQRAQRQRGAFLPRKQKVERLH
ncbi:MAG: amino acid adenylation domain-containing protein [Nitrosomonas sp.]|nr:MAG: amino acid adenylation domain-containing protein [Nitrosomonas sp.]